MPLFMDLHEGSATDARPAAAEHSGRADASHEASKRFVEAVAAKDYRGMFAALTRDARFRFLLPGGPGYLRSRGILDGALTDGDAVAAFVAELSASRHGPDPGAPYRPSSVARALAAVRSFHRFLVHEQEGWEVIEQQLYLDVNEEGQIAAIDLLCSGFRAVA